MYRGTEIPFFDFKGGMASNRFGTNLEPNQAVLLRNIYINTGGGIEKRRGDTAFNASAMVGATTAIAGLGDFNALSGTEYLVAVAGTSIFQSSVTSGTMTDITGTLSLIGGQNAIWDFVVFNDNIIAIGGTPDAPWKWTGSGNGSLLGGSPPTGNFGFQQNNRVFIGNTTANPSRIYWSVISNAADWSGTGSGSADVWTNDGDNLVGAGVLGDDNVLLFKQRSIHRLVGRTAPFPIFPLFNGVGAVGKHAIVVVDGICYFITPRGRMKATDGNQVIDFSNDIDDIWDSLSASRLQYIQGVRYTGQGFDHLIWHCSTSGSSTNNLAIVWDLTNKCWLQHTTGYKANVVAKTQAGALYGGQYDGKIYKKDVASTYTDASESSAGIDSLWRSGWLTNKSFQMSLHPARINFGLVTQTAGSLQVGYGFDFATDQTTETIDMQVSGGLWDLFLWDDGIWGGQSDAVKTIFLMGRGNATQFTLSNSTASQTFKIHGFTVSGKKSGQKQFQAA